MSRVPWGTEFFEDSEDFGDEAPTCDTCKDSVASRPWLPPFRTEIEAWYRVYADFLMGFGDDFLISERFKGVVESEGLIGFNGFEPVRIVKVTTHRRLTGAPPKYYRVNVVRTHAAWDVIASGFRWDDPQHPICPKCRSRGFVRGYSGLVLERGSWTGADIFCPRGLKGRYMVSERFKAVYESHAVTGVLLVPSEQHWLDFYPEDNMERCQAIMDLPLSEDVLERTSRHGYRSRYVLSSNECAIYRWDGCMSLINPIGGLATWQAL